MERRGIRKNRELSSRDRKKLVRKIRNNFGDSFADFLTQNRILEVEDGKNNLLVVKGKAYLFIMEKKTFPSLHAVRGNFVKIPSLTVDKGAVKHVLNGADIFLPGVTHMEDFEEDEPVLIKNQEGTPLCIGISLMNSETARKQKIQGTGKVVLNFHWLSDSIFSFIL